MGHRLFQQRVFINQKGRGAQEFPSLGDINYRRASNESGPSTSIRPFSPLPGAEKGEAAEFSRGIMSADIHKAQRM